MRTTKGAVMSDFDDLLARARALPPAERERLAQALRALSVPQLGGASGAPGPHSVAWLKAERGHAVLATDTGPAEQEIPAGWEAIAGIWASREGT
jgi:hypothetical protein